MNATQTTEKTLSDAFLGGALRRRELRLDPAEAEYAKSTGAVVRELAPSGDKAWYEISYEEARHAD